MRRQSMLPGAAFLVAACALCLPLVSASAGGWDASDYSGARADMSERAGEWSERLRDRMRDDYERRERRAALREMLADPEARAELRAMLVEAMRERSMQGGMYDRSGAPRSDMMDRMRDRAGMMGRGDCPGRSVMRDEMRGEMQGGIKERLQSGANRMADRSDDIRELILERLRNNGEVRLLIARIQDRVAPDSDEGDDDDDDGKL